MGLVSLEYLFFLILVFFFYFLIPKKIRWVVLLAASYTFYFLCSWKYLPFIAATTLTTFYAGILMGNISGKARERMAGCEDRARKKAVRDAAQARKSLIIAACLELDFGILAVLKYYNFFASVTVSVFGKGLPHLELLLPLGISFYTFQSVGYIVDVYHAKYEPDRNLAKFALFISFFPQLIQGPISRYDRLAGQLYEGHAFDAVRARSALRLMFWGYFKKCIVADKLAVLVEAVFDAPGDCSGAVIAFGAVCYGVQIYADFSGGIDVIRGVAQFLGINMEQNFNQPYFSTSLSDFWRRWHITLGNWMRTYVFYPLALSKGLTRWGRRLSGKCGRYLGKAIPLCVATIVTFLAVGVWHGAGWKYLVYGLWNGVIISLGTLTDPFIRDFYKKIRFNSECRIWTCWRVLRTFLIVTIGRFFTRAADVKTAFFMMGSILTRWRGDGAFLQAVLGLGVDWQNLIIAAFGVLMMIVVGVLREKGRDIRGWFEQRPVLVQMSLELVGVVFMVVFAEYGADYNPNDFIYAVF